MNSKQKYRVTVGDCVAIQSVYPNWDAIFRVAEERGLTATLEKRLVTEADPLWLAGLHDKNGNLPAESMILQNLYVSSWELSLKLSSVRFTFSNQENHDDL